MVGRSGRSGFCFLLYLERELLTHQPPCPTMFPDPVEQNGRLRTWIVRPGPWCCSLHPSGDMFSLPRRGFLLMTSVQRAGATRNLIGNYTMTTLKVFRTQCEGGPSPLARSDLKPRKGENSQMSRENDVYDPRKSLSAGVGDTHDHCMCQTLYPRTSHSARLLLLSSLMEAVAEDQGMKQETFDASKM
jgi:hypothetical protein